MEVLEGLSRLPPSPPPSPLKEEEGDPTRADQRMQLRSAKKAAVRKRGSGRKGHHPRPVGFHTLDTTQSAPIGGDHPVGRRSPSGKPGSPTMSDLLLDVRGLRTAFRTSAGAWPAVDGVDLSLRRGEILGLVGESGSGKSVTGFSLMGLIDPPGEVVAGEGPLQGRRPAQAERGRHAAVARQPHRA